MIRWTPADIPSQAGKRALVTGANSGIGFHAARHLARAGCAVLLGCRDISRAEEARRLILQDSPSALVEIVLLDLASLKSIHAAGELLLTRGAPLDLLINNAGVMALPARQTTEDGFERQFGINHLGHFALTGLLMPLVLAAPAGRIVTVSSIAHKDGRMRFEDLQYASGYKPWLSYRQSKLANLLFGFQLERRLERADARAISVMVHPGLAATRILANGPGTSRGVVSTFGPIFMSLLAQSDEQGSYPTLYGATSGAALGGHYYGPDGMFEFWGVPVEVKAKPWATDPAAAALLWEVSEKLTGVHYTI
ncbi:MAG TPA: oxidoreductase [Acidisarcina sp.]